MSDEKIIFILRERLEEVNTQRSRIAQSISELEQKLQEYMMKAKELERLAKNYHDVLDIEERALARLSEQPNRWEGVSLMDAIRQLIAEKPEISKEQILEILTGYPRFDFGDRAPSRVIHMALTNLEREKRSQYEKDTLYNEQGGESEKSDSPPGKSN